MCTGAFCGVVSRLWKKLSILPFDTVTPLGSARRTRPESRNGSEDAISSLDPTTTKLDVAPANAQIVHSGQACVVKEDNISERIYTIREGDTLVLQCLVKGHPRPQVRWTKTAGSASDKFQDTPIFNETLRIDNIQRVQGGRYYCKAENGVGVAAIKSIRVDVQ
ncbi:MAM domain-containing glycosylphosphatidylinositol anchor protein 1-like, partial [Clarias magur]